MFNNTSAYSRMKSLMEKMDYSFSNSSITRAEIMAYGNALQLVTEKFEKVLSDSFLNSCDEERLLKFEILLGIENSENNSNLRKEKIKQRLCEKYGFFSVSDLTEKIAEKGDNLSFSLSSGTLEVSGFNSNDEEKIRFNNMNLNASFPCFLSSSLGNRKLSFNDWEAMAKPFTNIDKMKFRFDNLDTWGGLQ